VPVRRAWCQVLVKCVYDDNQVPTRCVWCQVLVKCVYDDNQVPIRCVWCQVSIRCVYGERPHSGVYCVMKCYNQACIMIKNDANQVCMK